MYKILSETFAAKIFLVSILSIIVLSMSLTGYFVYREWRSKTEYLDWQGEVLTRLLADTARLGVFAENSDMLKDPVESVLQGKEVLYVSIYNQDGALLTENTKQGNSSRNQEFSIPEQEKGATLKRLRRAGRFLSISRKRDMVDFWAPVMAGPDKTTDEALYFGDRMFGNRERTIGFVRIVFDKGILNRSLGKLILNSSLIGLFFLFAATVIVFLVVKGITRPLNTLTERVRIMGSGATLEKVAVETGDEIGKLATAFNSMTDSLQARDVEKERLEHQLRHAQKMEAIGTLAGGVAHDFNNILSVIESCAELLQNRIKKSSSIRSYVEQIISAASRAGELTRRLLIFSRSQALNPKAVDLNTVVRDISVLLKRLVGENIEFRLVLSCDDLIVMADELQIDQIVINLVTNARDAMPQGGQLSIMTEMVEIPSSQVEEAKKPGPGVYARLSVSDTGAGIDPEKRERIFDPFFTTKEVGKGTGLGLSMAFGIVTQHQGHIDVESEPGKGTVFSVYLPLIDAALERKKDESLFLPVGNGETILVAEDDRFVRMLTKHILTKYGYQVIDAEDGEAALEKFREHADDIRLLLCDVVMPKKNGVQLMSEIRRIRPEVKFIFFSGHTHDILNTHGFDTREVLLLSKPMKPGEMLMAVRAALDAQPLSTRNEEPGGMNAHGEEAFTGE
ncbi:MAG: ATP-binding protein [Geobacteraceae bacterium]|nr:ATP-binding protein [Geobacteraceae bacterium]